jgi:hypothetical protein
MHISTDLEFARNQKLLCRLGCLMQRRLKIAALFAIIGLAAGCGGSPSASTAADPLYRTAQGIAVYIGLMPAAIVKGYPGARAEAAMHGGPPSGRHEYHLVVAVFDAATGQRISDAAVKARISEPGSGSSELALEPMNVVNTITYGGYVALPSAARYVIRIDVKQPQAASVALDFSYDHQPP